MAGAIYANAEVVNYGTTWVPTALANASTPYTRTTAILCTSAGTLVCDLLGNLSAISQQAGATSISIPFAANQIIELAVIKVHTGSSGSFVALY